MINLDKKYISINDIEKWISLCSYLELRMQTNEEFREAFDKMLLPVYHPNKKIVEPYCTLLNKICLVSVSPKIEGGKSPIETILQNIPRIKNCKKADIEKLKLKEFLLERIEVSTPNECENYLDHFKKNYEEQRWEEE